MKCENIFCIYCDGDRCELEEISLDISGICTECIYIEIDEKLLSELKKRKGKAF